MTAENEPSTERLIAGVERAVAVLGALADDPHDLGTNEIARRTGINASTVSRLLTTLAKEELVSRVAATGRYRLGVGLVRLGHAALARVDLREVVRPHLLALMEATGETTTLSIPGRETAVTVDFVQSPSTVRSVAEIGRPSVPHATASGKVYLAYAGSLPDGPLHAYTGNTITDRARLQDDIAVVRERGWAEACGERETDLHAVAVPILDTRGALVAVLGVQGPAGRFGAPAMQRAVGHLREHAAALTALT
jgi:DNA-binding IclR family transcriptional regulator